MTKNRRHAFVTAAVLAAAATFAGCASSVSTTTPTTEAPKASGAVIVIRDFAFRGALTVKAGATVTVRNEDPTAHTITASDGSFDTKPIPANSSVSFVATKPGPHAFHCAIHDYMQGTLTVTR